MAVSLPYPDMDFVPLDTLTAEEMNEIVANIEYIADLFPLSSDNIDLTTFDVDYTTAKVIGKSGNKTYYRWIKNYGAFGSSQDTDFGDQLPSGAVLLPTFKAYAQLISDGNFIIPLNWNNGTEKINLYHKEAGKWHYIYANIPATSYNCVIDMTYYLES